MSAATFDQARAVADAVLYEGYVLYPYRASSAKNQVRWQFGVLMPPAGADAESGEYSDLQAECLLEAGPHARLHLRLRFLQVQARTVHGIADDGSFHPVGSLRVGEDEIFDWDEAVERELDLHAGIGDLLAGVVTREVAVDGGEQVEHVAGGRIVRCRNDLQARITLGCHRLEGPYGGLRLRVSVQNTTPATGGTATGSRDQSLRSALIAAHLLLVLDDGAFLSLTDPPEWAAPAAAECENVRSWPVLVGDPDRRNAMLAAPIILYDYPSIAPESAGAMYDGTEIDEILTLRTMALTEAEKAEARATDPRARELVDRVDDLPPELMDRLHGTLRYLRSVTDGSPAATDGSEPPRVPWWDPGADASVDPQKDSVVIGGVEVRRGSPVILRPGVRRSDAQDMFLSGRRATVQAVLFDVDGERHLAVTVDDDLAAEMQTEHGRFRYFSPDEIEPIAGEVPS